MNIRVFRDNSATFDAYNVSAEGGQGLCVPIAWLYDRDLSRLKAAAKELGIKKPMYEEKGTTWQRLILYGDSLKKALAAGVSKPDENGQLSLF